MIFTGCIQVWQKRDVCACVHACVCLHVYVCVCRCSLYYSLNFSVGLKFFNNNNNKKPMKAYQELKIRRNDPEKGRGGRV